MLTTLVASTTFQAVPSQLEAAIEPPGKALKP